MCVMCVCVWVMVWDVCGVCCVCDVGGVCVGDCGWGVMCWWLLYICVRSGVLGGVWGGVIVGSKVSG